MVRQSSSAQRREDYDEVAPRRNPYLVDYEEQRSRRGRETESRGSRAAARGMAGTGGPVSNGRERVRIHRLDTDESRAAGGRRPIAYGSRMAGSREPYGGGTAADDRLIPDPRADYDRSFPEERMPMAGYEPDGWDGMTAAPAGSPDRGRRREVTTDMFDGYRDREPARKGKIVQVPIPTGGNRKRQPQSSAAGQRGMEPYRSGARQSMKTQNSVRQPIAPKQRSAEQYPARRPGGMARSRVEARPKAAVQQRGETRQKSMARRRDKVWQEDMLWQRSAPKQRSAARQPGTVWQPGAARQQSAAARRQSAAALQSPAAAPDRKEKLFRIRLLLGAWVLCILLFAVYFAVKNRQADAPEENALPVSGDSLGNLGQPAGTMVQGIPADAFAKHPEWTEDFLTPNEYSRPGEPLESVKNIFVHYTANPGTSAAQNRSYFEWQKDTHEASVSSHFIIGYEGEIIQCVPLDEIAYAVMTRNYDSVSIECCYLAEDGSFTQETYDSLISLLAWLTDIYGLDSEDILRHYDCGGKKCPLYYTEHEDAWEQLKKDVDKL